MFELRTLLPEKVVNSTRAVLQPASRSAPEKLAAQLKEAAVTGSKDIQKFKKDYHSDAMRKLFQKVNAAEIPQGQDAWTTDYIALSQKMNSTDTNTTASAESAAVTDDDVKDSEAVQQFCEANPAIDVKVLDEASGLPLELNLPSIAFHVGVSSDGAKKGYNVSLKDGGSSSKTNKEVVQYVQTRHAKQKLPALLVSILSLHSDAC